MALSSLERDQSGLAVNPPIQVQVGQVSPPTEKLHLATLRALFDALVTPRGAHQPRRQRPRGAAQAVEGKTPAIIVQRARRLLASIAPRP